MKIPKAKVTVGLSAAIQKKADAYVNTNEDLSMELAFYAHAAATLEADMKELKDRNHDLEARIEEKEKLLKEAIAERDKARKAALNEAIGCIYRRMHGPPFTPQRDKKIMIVCADNIRALIDTPAAQTEQEGSKDV
jgi:septal ring factor EnvC (AmiA/AmiB activator)